VLIRGYKIILKRSFGKMKDENGKAVAVLLILVLLVGGFLYRSKIKSFVQQATKGKVSFSGTKKPAYHYSGTQKKVQKKRMIEKGNRLIEEGKYWLAQGKRSFKRAKMYEAGRKKEEEKGNAVIPQIKLSEIEYQSEFAKKLQQKGEEYTKKGKSLIDKGQALIDKAKGEEGKAKDD